VKKRVVTRDKIFIPGSPGEKRDNHACDGGAVWKEIAFV
jgi:hypothetical protein